MGTSLWKITLTFFCIASFVQTQAYLPEHLEREQKAPNAFLILLDEDKTPLCKMDFVLAGTFSGSVADNAFIKGLRECDERDAAYMQTLDLGKVVKAGVAGKVAMVLSALILSAVNAVETCWANLKYGLERLKEYEEGFGEYGTSGDEVQDDIEDRANKSLWRGAAYGLVYTGLGIFVLGKQSWLAAAAWGLGLQIPISYGAGHTCSVSLEDMDWS